MILLQLEGYISNVLIDVPELDYTITFENVNIEKYIFRKVKRIYYDGADSNIIIEII